MSFFNTDEPTTGGFRCSECGQHTNMLVNTRCLACATKVTPVRGSWICARCGVSNAPHVDRCGCHPDVTISFTGRDRCRLCGGSSVQEAHLVCERCGVLWEQRPEMPFPKGIV